MKITFNGMGSGYGDNGGTATIFHSANVLSKLGHEIIIVSDKPSYFTWFGLEGPKYIKTQRYDYPEADVLIATGVGSIKHVLDSPSKKGIKIWWIRAHETWMTKQDMLFGIYRNKNLELMVNSVCLQKFISRHIGRRAEIIRPGIDVSDFFSERERNWKGKKVFTLGSLYNEKPRKRFKWVPEIYEQLKIKDINVKLNIFGTYDKPAGFEYDKYVKKPSIKQLRKFYNSVDIWIAPTKSEGLHIPPQEAMLCECVVVGAGAELSGMADYLDTGTTGFVVPDWPEAVNKIAGLILDEDRLGLSTISSNGRNKILELGDREHNMKLFLKFLDAKLGKVRRNQRELRHRGIRL